MILPYCFIILIFSSIFMVQISITQAFLKPPVNEKEKKDTYRPCFLGSRQGGLAAYADPVVFTNVRELRL